MEEKIKQKKVKVVKNVSEQGTKLLPELKTAHVKELRDGYKAIIEENVTKKCPGCGSIIKKKEWVSYTHLKKKISGYSFIERKSYFLKDLTSYGLMTKNGSNETYRVVEVLKPHVLENNVKKRCLELLVGESSLPSDNKKVLLENNSTLTTGELFVHITKPEISYADLVKSIMHFRNKSELDAILSVEATLSRKVFLEYDKKKETIKPLIKSQF